MVESISRFVSEKPTVAIGIIGTLIAADAVTLVVSRVQVNAAKKEAESAVKALEEIHKEISDIKTMMNIPTEEVEVTTETENN